MESESPGGYRMSGRTASCNHGVCANPEKNRPADRQTDKPSPRILRGHTAASSGRAGDRRLQKSEIGRAPRGEAAGRPAPVVRHRPGRSGPGKSGPGRSGQTGAAPLVTSAALVNPWWATLNAPGPDQTGQQTSSRIAISLSCVGIERTAVGGSDGFYMYHHSGKTQTQFSGRGASGVPGLPALTDRSAADVNISS